MSFAETHRVHGIRCDKGGCAEEITGPDLKLFIGHRHYEQVAQEQGWTIWTGRGRRIYCPRHGPTKGHGMTPEKAVQAPTLHRQPRRPSHTVALVVDPATTHGANDFPSQGLCGEWGLSDDGG